MYLFLSFVTSFVFVAHYTLIHIVFSKGGVWEGCAPSDVKKMWAHFYQNNGGLLVHFLSPFLLKSFRNWWWLLWYIIVFSKEGVWGGCSPQTWRKLLNTTFKWSDFVHIFIKIMYFSICSFPFLPVIGNGPPPSSNVGGYIPIPRDWHTKIFSKSNVNYYTQCM